MANASWTFQPLVVLWLGGFVTIYVGGLLALWRSAGVGRGISVAQASAFAGGWLTLVVALMSPLDWVSDWLFSAHMLQHELLMIVAAPLIAASAPIVAATWWLRRVRGGPMSLVRIQPAVMLATSPTFVWSLHAATLWIWHVPSLFQGAMVHESVHVLQHFSFFSTACLFWWGMTHGRYGRMGYGIAVVYVFATAVQSGVLGALLTFSADVWYPIYSATTLRFGLTPLEDQQLAGLFMWIPASVVFLAGGLMFLAAWIRESERRVSIQHRSKHWSAHFLL